MPSSTDGMPRGPASIQFHLVQNLLVLFLRLLRWLLLLLQFESAMEQVVRVPHMARSKSGIVRICRLHMLLTLGLLCESGFRHRHFSRLNATEAEMIAAARNLALAAAAYQVAGAVLVSTQERSAAQNALLFARFGGVPGRIGPLWIVRRPALRRQLLVVIRAVPVAGPLPDVARHVVESVRVGGKLRHRSDARESIRALVLERKMALVGVGHPLSLRMKVVSPGVEVPGEAAARGELPLGFRGQALAHPLGVG